MSKIWCFRNKKNHKTITVKEGEMKWEKQVDSYKSNRNLELFLETEGPKAEPRLIKEVPVIEDVLECPLCGKVAANDEELIKHKEEHYGKSKKRGRKKKI